MTALPDYADALDLALAVVTRRVAAAEAVALHRCLGRVLAEPIRADRDLPPFDRAEMDGYALLAAEFGSVDEWHVAGRISAGDVMRVQPTPAGHCIAIATGAPLPPDVDTVIPHELSDRGDLHGRPVRFTIDSVKPGSAVHPCGSDGRAGEVLVEAGAMLQPQHIGIAAAVGCDTLHVRARPRVVTLASGDEIIPRTQSPAPHQVRNSNGPMLAALLERMGAEVIAHHHLPDEYEPTERAVGDALRTADLLITVGGVSAGERDYFPAAFDEHRVQRALHGAAIQPGRPIFVGHAEREVGVIGLPGNPVSTLACSCLFAWPIVRALLGLDSQLPWRRVRVTEPVKPSASRRAFRPAILVDETNVIVPRWSGSGDLAHTARTHGLAELPVQAEEIAAGAALRFLPWP
jgi:molybdopterin molybdotransferase